MTIRQGGTDRRLRMFLGRTLSRRMARETVAFFQMHVLTVTDHAPGRKRRQQA